MSAFQCSQHGDRDLLCFTSPRSILFCAVDASFDSAERCWSPKMYDALLALFGADWRTFCQETMFQVNSKSGCKLPTCRDGVFDMNSLTSLLVGLHRSSATLTRGSRANQLQAWDHGNPKSAAHFNIGQISGAFRLPGCSVYKKRYDNGLSDDEVSEWIQHLSYTIFAFRQQYAHKSTDVTAETALDALMAMAELWPDSSAPDGTQASVDSYRDHGNIPAPISSATPSPGYAFDTALKLVKQLCMEGTTGVDQSFVCSPSLVLKMISSQALHLVEQLPGNIVQEIALGGGHGPKLDALKAMRKIAFHCAKANPDTVRNGIRQALHLVELYGRQAEERSFLKSLLDSVAPVARALKGRHPSTVAKCKLTRPSTSGDQDMNQTKRHFIQQPRARPQFIGRQKEMESILHDIQPHHVTVVAGGFGCGKTALAIEVARVLRDKFPIQFWILGSSRALLELSMRRVQAMLHLVQHRYEVEDHDKGSQETGDASPCVLFVIDGLNRPSQFNTTSLACGTLRNCAILCTSHCADVCTWSQIVGPTVSLQKLPPLELCTSLRQLMSRYSMLQRNPRALADLVIDADKYRFTMQRNMVDPLTIAAIATTLSSSPELVTATRSMFNWAAPPAVAVGHPAQGTGVGYTLAFHNAGPRALLEKAIPQLPGDSRALLYSIASLCSKTASISWSMFTGTRLSDYDYGNTPPIERFLVDSSPEMASRRQNALDRLCEYGLLSFNLQSQRIEVPPLVQKEVMHSSGHAVLDGLISASQIQHGICVILHDGFKQLVCHAPNFSDGLLNWQPMHNLLAATEGFLCGDLFSCLDNEKLSLQLWTSRLCFCIALWDTSLLWYEAALETAQCIGSHNDAHADRKEASSSVPCDTIIMLEYAMVLWRAGKVNHSIHFLERVQHNLGKTSQAYVTDPCSKGELAVRQLHLATHEELLYARLNSPDESWSLQIMQHNIDRPNNQTSSSLSPPEEYPQLMIGPLANKAFEHTLTSVLEDSLVLAQGGLVETGLEALVMDAIVALESDCRGTEGIHALCSSCLAMMLSPLCNTDIAFDFYAVLAVDLMTAVLSELLTGYNSQLALPSMDLPKDHAEIVNEAFCIEKLIPLLGSLVGEHYNFSQRIQGLLSCAPGALPSEEEFAVQWAILLVARTSSIFYSYISLIKKSYRWSFAMAPGPLILLWNMWMNEFGFGVYADPIANFGPMNPEKRKYYALLGEMTAKGQYPEVTLLAQCIANEFGGLRVWVSPRMAGQDEHCEKADAVVDRGVLVDHVCQTLLEIGIVVDRDVVNHVVLEQHITSESELFDYFTQHSST
ncbi:uncharacterized protein LOC135809646 isoform X2 [Sycon ciliatum]|uniref:uncharacterized protein LOC135809646 isoform X2 n=1 Tax=Sycon ciliatum TaxID=27933 RepID=UPI0031F61432